MTNPGTPSRLLTFALQPSEVVQNSELKCSYSDEIMRVSACHFISRAIMTTLLNVCYWVSAVFMVGKGKHSLLLLPAVMFFLYRLWSVSPSPSALRRPPLTMKLACIYLVNDILRTAALKYPIPLTSGGGESVCVCISKRERERERKEREVSFSR